MRYWMKNCPRCRGDLREEADVYGTYIACLQCGYILPVNEEQMLLATGTPEPARSQEKLAA
jgi:hypothetical protein